MQPQDFVYGTICMIVKLKTKPELNGRAVRICLAHPQISKDRVPCELMIGCDKLAIKPENLRYIATEDELEDEDVRNLMPEADVIDCGMLMHAERGSTVITPGVTLMRIDGGDDSQ